MSASLPHGWVSFASVPDEKNRTHWYATSPYPVNTLKAEYGSDAYRLCPTVTAPTWPELHAQVAFQVEVYKLLTGEGDEGSSMNK